MEITSQDREELLTLINSIPNEKILIVHGTDTMEETARFLESKTQKTIVFTGAMVPYSIDSVEATANFALGLGYLLNCEKNEIFIAMHGLVKKHRDITKNRQKGIFECLS